MLNCDLTGHAGPVTDNRGLHPDTRPTGGRPFPSLINAIGIAANDKLQRITSIRFCLVTLFISETLRVRSPQHPQRITDGFVDGSYMARQSAQISPSRIWRTVEERSLPLGRL